MHSNRQGDVWPALTWARRQYQVWRQAKRRRQCIPDALWFVAVKAAIEHGLIQTSQARRLNHCSLPAEVRKQPHGPMVND